MRLFRLREPLLPQNTPFFFKKEGVSVRPDPGDLDYVRGTVPTPRGLITVEAECSGKVNITLTDGVTAV